MNKKTFLLLFLGCVLVPLVAAKVSLELGWFNHGDLNRGQWLEQELQLLPAAVTTRSRWYLVYVQGDSCAQHCTQSLYILQQLYSGLGRKQQAVQPIVIAAQQPQVLAQFPALDWVPITAAATQVQDQILLANQQGLALLRYAPVDANTQIPQLAKDIRTDLLRLMNYDRSNL